MPRRAALSVLNALTALLIAPDLSSDLALSHFSPSSHHPNSLSIAPKSPSHSLTPSHLSLRVFIHPQAPMAPQGRSQHSKRSSSLQRPLRSLQNA